MFTVVDVKSGFWRIPLHEESTYLTCFNTPLSSYRWLRILFGISSTPEMFQRQMHQLAEGLSGVEVIHDDFIVVGCGKTYEESLKKNEKNLRYLLLRCQDQHVTIGKDKLKLNAKEVTYVGHIF